MSLALIVFHVVFCIDYTSCIIRVGYTPFILYRLYPYFLYFLYRVLVIHPVSLFPVSCILYWLYSLLPVSCIDCIYISCILICIGYTPCILYPVSVFSLFCILYAAFLSLFPVSCICLSRLSSII